MGSIPLELTTAVRYSPTNPAPWPSNRWIFNGYPFPSGTLPFRLVPSHPAQLRQHDGNGAVIASVRTIGSARPFLPPLAQS